MSTEASRPRRATERAGTANAFWGVWVWPPLLAVMLWVVPRVWLPLLDREASPGELFLWVIALPTAAMLVGALVGYAAWDVRRRIGLARELTRDTVSRERAFEEGGFTTLTGVIEGADEAAPLSTLPCVAWARRLRTEDASAAALASSHAAPFTLALDDGTRIEADGGEWRVVDPFAPWVLVGEARIEAGDRVRVRGRVAVSLESSGGDYRASAKRRRLVADGGLIAPARSGPSRRSAVRSSWGVVALACVVMLVHALARLRQPAPVHFDAALGARCDRRHLCATRSYCDEGRGATNVCRRDCERDADCGEEMRCSEYTGRCELDDQSYGRPGTRTQGQDCTRHQCAPDHRCIRNLMRGVPDAGAVDGPESYCVRVCRRDDQCPAGTVCTVISPATHPEAWCDRPENLLPIIRMTLEWRRDASLP